MNQDERQRLDREFEELLSELRVLIPGVTVLFGFLLTLPFTATLSRQSDVNRAVYFVAFLAIATAVILFIAPTSQHRVRWRQHQKDRLLPTGNRFTVAGTVFLAIGLIAVVFLVCDVLYGTGWAAFVTALVATLVASCWYGLAYAQHR